MVIAKVRVNKKWAIVLDEPIKLLYNHQDERTIVGRFSFSAASAASAAASAAAAAAAATAAATTAATTAATEKKVTLYFVYHQVPNSKEAFGGRAFEIPLVNGYTIQAHGDWWHSAMDCDTHSGIGAAYIEDLKKCYVFSSYEISNEDLASLPEAPEFEYWGYENYIKGSTMINVNNGRIDAKLVYGLRIAERDLTDYQRENRRISPADRRSKAYKKLAVHIAEKGEEE